MKRFFFLLFALLFIGVGIEAKPAPPYLDVGVNKILEQDFSQEVAIGEMMVMLQLDFYIFQAGYGSQLASAEDGGYKLLPFLAVQTEGVSNMNFIVSRQNDDIDFSCLHPEKQEKSIDAVMVCYGYGQINRWTLRVIQSGLTKS